MATIRRLSGPSRSASPKRPASRATRTTGRKPSSGKTKAESFDLPEERSDPINSIEDCIFTLYGEKKIGKTSLAGEFPDAMFLFCEPGGKGLSLYERQCPDWKAFVGYVDSLTKTERFRTVVVDTIDKAYEKCFNFVCKRELIEHPGDESWGKGWKMINDEFVQQMDKLVTSKRGVVFISHAEVREFQSRTGGTYNKIVPSMSASARRYISGIADVIGYYGYYGQDRYLTIRGSDTLEAGHRLKYKFWTTEGERVQSIPMFSKKNKSFGETEAYANLVKAFDNEQANTGDPELATALTETPVKRQTRR